MEWKLSQPSVKSWDTDAHFGSFSALCCELLMRLNLFPLILLIWHCGVAENWWNYLTVRCLSDSFALAAKAGKESVIVTIVTIIILCNKPNISIILCMLYYFLFIHFFSGSHLKSWNHVFFKLSFCVSEFIPCMDKLFDEAILIGSGYTARETLRWVCVCVQSLDLLCVSTPSLSRCWFPSQVHVKCPSILIWQYLMLLKYGGKLTPNTAPQTVLSCCHV